MFHRCTERHQELDQLRPVETDLVNESWATIPGGEFSCWELASVSWRCFVLWPCWLRPGIWSPLVTTHSGDLSSECGELATDHWQHWVKRVSQTRIILAATSLHHYGPESGPVLLLGNNKPILYRNYLKQKTELISKSLLARRLLLLVVEEFGILMQERVSVSPADKCFLRLPLLSE